MRNQTKSRGLCCCVCFWHSLSHLMLPGLRRFSLSQSWLGEITAGYMRVSSSRSSAQTLICGAAFCRTSSSQVTAPSSALFSQQRKSMLVQLWWKGGSQPVHQFHTPPLYFDLNVLKVETPYCLGSPSDSRRRSRACCPLTWGNASMSSAPWTETSLCGVAARCLPTCSLSTQHG